jgi:diguanylate cyclase (GGDEF)-like protein
MDPTTAFVIAALMMLLNGAVLGLIHRDLPLNLRPSAFHWRLGTLLIAVGCVLLALQRWLPIQFLLPLANGLILTGTVGYVHALRRFDGTASSPLMWSIPVIGAFCIWIFSDPVPDLRGRVLSASLGLTIAMGLGAAVLLRGPRSERAISRQVLALIWASMAVFFLLRAITIGLRGDAAATVLDSSSWLNIVTPMIAAVMPVIGTTCFLLMCSERLRRDLERAALTDQLTGLANRRSLTLDAQARMAAARQGSAPFALAVIDIDHFKHVNDRHGHETGDAALRHVADLLCRHALPGATVCRHGGEEFVVLYGASDCASAKSPAEQLCAGIAGNPYLDPERQLELPITVSIGVSCWRPGDQLDDLLRRADQALYVAKAEGRDRVEVEA